jgi:Xaa-Pro aminopeptidase
VSKLRLDRLQRFQRILAENGFDCYVAGTPISMGYLAGFFEGGGERMLALFIRPEGDPAMIVPSLSRTHAETTGVVDIRDWRDGEDPGELFEQLAKEWGLTTAVIGVDDEIPAAILLRMQTALPAALFKAAGDLMAEARISKEAEELAAMREAAQVAEKAFDAVLPLLRPGMTEHEVSLLLQKAMLDQGGQPTFCIVASGANGAEPHHSSDETPLREGDVLVVDWGCSVNHYLSDITRTIALGDPGQEAKDVYSVVLEAHLAARNAIRPGVPAEEIDAAARKVIEDAGFGDRFIHRTGHGIGMMGHEPPMIVRGNAKPLVEGQCFSVEPGIYLPGKFGVRIENIVTVTSTGHESLNGEPPRELTVVAV